MDRTKRRMPVYRAVWKYRAFYAMISVGVVFFFLFKYATLYGLLIAFKNYKFKLGILGSEWVGLKNFTRALSNPDVPKVVWNTLVISFGKLIIGFPAPILLALLLNELRSRRFLKVAQSILYLPYFISWIVMAGICSNLFSSTSGVIPKLTASIGLQMPSLIADPKYFRGFLYGSEVWKNVGWNTIIFMAAITVIDPELYEAGKMDGCNRFQQAIHITLPCISATVVVLLILNLGGVMNAGFDQIFNLQTSRTKAVSNIIDTYLYELGLISGKYEYATVIGMLKSIVNAILLFSTNIIAGRLTGTKLF